jgi:hypothetical protein
MNTPNQVINIHSCWCTEDFIFYYTLQLSGMHKIQVAILTDMYLKGTISKTRNIFNEARRQDFRQPDVLLTDLLRNAFSLRDVYDMSLLRIVVMHNPIRDSVQKDNGCVKPLLKKHTEPDYRWDSETGFAFIVPHQ